MKSSYKNRDIITMIIFIIAVLLLGGIAMIKILQIHKNTIAQAPAYVYKKLHPKQYFGVNVDIGQLIPDSKYYITNSKGEDLIDIAHDLGINVFRIDNSDPPNINNQEIPTYTKAQWYEVLQKMNQNGISAILLTETSSTKLSFTPTSLNSSYLQFVKNYIINPQVCNNTDVYGIDLVNEPAINQQNLEILKKAANMIKKFCPETKITVGGWKTDTFTKDAQGNEYYIYNDPSSGSSLSSIVDFYSVHIYHFEQPINGNYTDPYSLTQSYLNQIKNYSGNMPILIEEFGAPNGDAISDQTTIGSPQLQANTYAGVFRAVHDMAGDKILGAISYEFYQRGYHPETWNILKDNGNYIFPAANYFSSAVSGDMIALSAVEPTTQFPNSSVLTISDNNKTIFSKVGDITGFHLQLPTAKYNVAITGDKNVLNTTEPLTQGWGTGYYDTVVHAQNPGIAQIVIKNGSNQVFQITITVSGS
jgi:hypothetical protein